MRHGPDVAVVGAGIAGCAAALAARRSGAQVVVLEAAGGATVLAGGGWDVAPPLHPDELLEPRHTVGEWLQAVARARPDHPYARLADLPSQVREAHALVLPALGGYRPLDLDGRGVLAATDLGLLRRVATAQREVLDLDAFSGDVGVVEPGAYPGWDARFVTDSLAEVVTRAGANRRFVQAAVPVLDGSVDVVRHPHELAAVADGDPGRVRLADGLRRAAESTGAAGLVLPPMLGVAADDVVEEVGRAVGVPVGEVLAALAGAQGLRLDRRIRAALEAAQVDVRYAPVEGLRPDGHGVRLELAGGEGLHAGAAVLATGKHVGGGLVVERGVVREPVAGLPVRAEGASAPLPSSMDGPDPVEQFGAGWARGGPGFALGVGYDAQLRGLGARGEPLGEGLFVAGALLDGFDPARDGTGLGCCATTGFVAGGHAAVHAGQSG